MEFRRVLFRSALVARVVDAVAVGVADVGRVADREEEARLRRADRLIETAAAADRDLQRARDRDAQAADQLHRALVERERRRVEARAAVELADDVELVGRGKRGAEAER